MPAEPPNIPFQRTRTTALHWLFFASGETEPAPLPVLAGAHLPVMLDMSPSGAHTPLKRDIGWLGLRSGITIAGMARSYKNQFSF
jgi:hypothetical protein